LKREKGLKIISTDERQRQKQTEKLEWEDGMEGVVVSRMGGAKTENRR
jgi:hypothetical protein